MTGGEMTDGESEFDPVGVIAEEFVARLRRGEGPSITEYANRFPEYAERIRAVISSLEIVERLKPEIDPPAGLRGVPARRPQAPA